MPTASYAVWVLAIQAAAYLGYLDFGLQTAIGRYIAYANETDNLPWRNGIYSTAFAGLSIAGAVGLLAVIVLALASPILFPSVPPALLPSLRVMILLVGASVAIGLPASAWNGIFIGMQRYEVPAITVGAAKLLSAAGVIWVATAHGSLIAMAGVVTAANVFSYAIQFDAKRRIAPSIHFQRELITLPIVKELSGYCLSLTVWSISMLLVNGFDVVLVGRFQFGAVTSYSVSATLILFLAGLQNALFGVIMPHAAELSARNQTSELGTLLIKTTRLGVLSLLLTGMPLIVFAHTIISTWIGPRYESLGGNILIILTIANIVRLIGVPYASILVGTGKQKMVVVSPIMEGVANLIASILFGSRFGAIGVAWGTLVGAVVGMLANLLYNIARTNDSIQTSRWGYFRTGIMIPMLCAAPIGTAGVYCAFHRPSTFLPWIIAFAASLFASMSLIVHSMPKSGRS